MEVMHTPGPWTWYWRSTDDGLEADCGIFHEQKAGHAVSICRAPRYATKETWSAKAALISAAPDMLEALESVMLEFGPGAMSDEAFSKAVAAISKAKGDA